jgi:hypothetical protein
MIGSCVCPLGYRINLAKIQVAVAIPYIRVASDSPESVRRDRARLLPVRTRGPFVATITALATASRAGLGHRPAGAFEIQDGFFDDLG